MTAPSFIILLMIISAGAFAIIVAGNATYNSLCRSVHRSVGRSVSPVLPLPAV